ncbi:MAG: DUF5615 family PIN-like protein [Elusimicrobia bacterium]|nr:DUF5615 family PIN-like protein [Elusimicrobiota bacterium]
MRPRFLLDEQISPRAARLASARGVDTRAVAGSDMAGLDDLAVFRRAVEEGRLLVTYDIADMSAVLADLLKEGVAVPGVVFVDRRTIPPSDPAGLAHALARLAGRIASGAVHPQGGIFLQRSR